MSDDFPVLDQPRDDITTEAARRFAHEHPDAAEQLGDALATSIGEIVDAFARGVPVGKPPSDWSATAGALLDRRAGQSPAALDAPLLVGRLLGDRALQAKLESPADRAALLDHLEDLAAQLLAEIVDLWQRRLEA